MTILIIHFIIVANDLIINPSYFNLPAFREFVKIDPDAALRFADLYKDQPYAQAIIEKAKARINK